MLVKKERKHYDKIKELSELNGFETIETPDLFAPFYTMSKKAKFFDRLEHMLRFKEQVVSPYGDLSLFNKMERIKLSYSILREFFRI